MDSPEHSAPPPETPADSASKTRTDSTDKAQAAPARKTPDVFDKLSGIAPSKLLEFLDQMLVFFPEDFRYRLKQVVDSIPAEGDNMQKILEVVRAQWKDIQSQKWVNIVVTGPAQTGKTSLIKAVELKRAADVAPIFSVAETPGLEEYLGYGQDSETPEQLKKADLIVLVLDGRYGISELTRQIVDRLRSLQVPSLVILNKCDQLEDTSATVRAAKKELGMTVIPTSIYRPESIDGLFKAMVAANSKILYPLASSFPRFRRTLCNGIVTQASVACGLVGLVPIPVSDLLPITAIQTAMVLKIARAFGCELNRERARELLPALAAGVAAREVGHRMRRRFPFQKKLVSVAVGGGWTFLLGRGAVGYFEQRAGVLKGGDVPRNLYAVS